MGSMDENFHFFLRHQEKEKEISLKVYPWYPQGGTKATLTALTEKS
jgi:hypothetical protein